MRIVIWVLLVVLAGCADDVATSNNLVNNGANNVSNNGSNNLTNNSANNYSNNLSNNSSNNVSNNLSNNSNNVVNNTTPVLTSVQAFARAEPYSRLIVEVDSVVGFEPTDVDEKLVEYLTDLVDKPDGISVVRDQELSSPGVDHVWTFVELQTLMNEQRSIELAANETRIHVAFVDGGYEGDSADGIILGIAWGTNVVMFEENIRASCQGPILQGRLCEYTELAIWLHEIGHVLGLVNNGAPLTAEHQDPDHGHHCLNPDCVMYWEYEGTKLVEALRGKLNTSDEALFEFDADCRADLAAIE